MKVSVITPVYNGEKYFEQCIDSIRNQSYSDLEIIIINDGSVDGTSLLAKEIANKDKRIIYIEKKNEGVSSARNSGINVATGEFIVFVDCDDTIERNYVELLLNKINKDDLDIVACGYTDISIYGSIKLNDFCNEDSMLNKDEFIINIFKGVGGTLWGKIFKTEIIKKNKIRLNEDIFMCEDMLFVSIRTGARVIPIINNQPVRGTCGYSGELGHVKVSGGSRICSCGRYGCLNSEISDVAIVNKIIDGIKVGRFREIAEAVQGDMDKVTMMSFINSVREGHADSLKLLDQVKGFIADILSMLVNIFAPRKIVLFGELAELGDILLDGVRERVSENIIKENSNGLKIMASEFGRNLGAMGAAAMVMQNAFEFLEEKI